MTYLTMNHTIHKRNNSYLEHPDVTSIIKTTFHFLMFAIGLFLQMKIIIVNKKEKCKTWQIHISHAILLTIVYPIDIFFVNALYWFPNIFVITGRWPCYIMIFVHFFGSGAIGLNSLLIAIMKYLFTVHALKSRVFGENIIQKIFFWVNLIHPFVLSTVLMLTTDSNENREFSKCLNPTLINLTPDSSMPQTWINLLIQIGLSMVYGANLIEGFIYFKIFQNMKR